ncbi:hypothetical protein OIU79_025025 [Salix purpurea]|uniref:Uncharacterized protein n=1 Tax=Salix purpurea TaxID=77065 RepID=A0A9Q0W6G6_SALPP|nr:hypothetical protein OIU79_025025 [Salix purpurea]
MGNIPFRLIQFRVFAPEIIEHLLIRGAKVVNVWFSEGRSRQLNVRTSSIRGDIKSMPLKQRMSLHASVLIGRTYHGVPEFHGLLIGSRVVRRRCYTLGGF